MAAFTNVTSDHLDRHGSLAAYRAVKRQFAERVDPAGALVLNLDDPIVASYARGHPGRPGSSLPAGRAAGPAASGLVDGWIVADRVEPLAIAGRGVAAIGSDGRIVPLDELTLPGRHNVANALAAVAIALLFGLPPDAIRAAAAGSSGSSTGSETVGTVWRRSRFVNDSQGTQPDAVAAALRAFDPPIVLIAGGRDKGIDLGELGPIVAERAAAAVLIGESGPDLERRFRAAGLARTERAATLEVRSAGRPRSPPSCGSQGAGDRADGPAQPGGRQLRHVRRLRGPRPRLQGGRGHAGGGGQPMTAPTTALRGRTRTRPSAGAPPKTLRRETHQPDYVILVAVIAMSAIGILMVFSSSAMTAYTQQGDVFATVAPQVAWCVAGLLAMLAMMRIDYRRLRLVSIPLYGIAVVLLLLVFCARSRPGRGWLGPLAQGRTAASRPSGRSSPSSRC